MAKYSSSDADYYGPYLSVGGLFIYSSHLQFVMLCATHKHRICDTNKQTGDDWLISITIPCPEETTRQKFRNAPVDKQSDGWRGNQSSIQSLAKRLNYGLEHERTGQESGFCTSAFNLLSGSASFDNRVSREILASGRNALLRISVSSSSRYLSWINEVRLGSW